MQYYMNAIYIIVDMMYAIRYIVILDNLLNRNANKTHSPIYIE